MFITAALFSLKRMPRIFMLILLFINVFLLAFLLLGCTTDTETYSSTYLVKYSFNKSSAIYPLIKSSYSSKNFTGYEDISVRTGYLSLCVDVDNETACASRSDLTSFKNITAVDIYTVNSNSSSTTLDIVSLAAEYSNEIVHPYILIASIILTIILFLSLLYIVIPGLLGKHFVTKFNLVLAPVLALLWGLGAMWEHVASKAGKSLVEKASMGIIKADIGLKASAMTWTPFTFFVIVAIGVIGLYFRDLNEIIEAVDSKV
jgi:hypothetical protein